MESRRFCDGLSTLIGVDEFELELDGRISGAMAFCSSALDHVPGLTLKVALIRSSDEPLVKPHGLRRENAVRRHEISTSQQPLSGPRCQTEHIHDDRFEVGALDV